MRIGFGGGLVRLAGMAIIVGQGLAAAPAAAQSQPPVPPAVAAAPAAQEPAVGGIAIGVIGGASPRGLQGGLRVNAGLGTYVSLDVDINYWGWTHFEDQHHLTIVRAQARIGRRHPSGWHVVGLVGAMRPLNTRGYSATAGLSIEKMGRGRQRIVADFGLGMFTGFANVGVLWGVR